MKEKIFNSRFVRSIVEKKGIVTHTSDVCVFCGKCAKICPQKIDIPAAMKNLEEEVAKLPSWAEIYRQREEAARKANYYL